MRPQRSREATPPAHSSSAALPKACLNRLILSRFCNSGYSENPLKAQTFFLLHRIQDNFEVASAGKGGIFGVTPFDVAWLCRTGLAVAVESGDDVDHASQF